MKYLLICSVILFQFPLTGQVYVNLEIIDETATFHTTVEASQLQVGELHELTISWIEETFPSEYALTQNAKTRVAANYSVDYTIKGNDATFKHDLQIDFQEGKANFTITDTSIRLVHANGDWKKHLSELRVKFEENCNELFWTYSKYLKEQQEKN